MAEWGENIQYFQSLCSCVHRKLREQENKQKDALVQIRKQGFNLQGIGNCDNAPRGAAAFALAAVAKTN